MIRIHLAFPFAIMALTCWLYAYLQAAHWGHTIESSSFTEADIEAIQTMSTRTWMLFDAFAKVFIIAAFAFVTTRYLHLFAVLMLGFAVNNLWDELRGNPLRLDWPEVVIAIILAVYITFRMVMMYGKSKRV